MAKVNMKLPDEFLLKISRLAENTDIIVPRVLEAGAEVVYEKVKSNLQAVIGSNTKHESKLTQASTMSTGELVSALGISPARLNRNNDFDIKIGFSEPRKNGISNAMVANVLEYGKHNQPPKPFLKPAKSASKDACTAAMVAKLEEELSQL